MKGGAFDGHWLTRLVTTCTGEGIMKQNSIKLELKNINITDRNTF